VRGAINQTLRVKTHSLNEIHKIIYDFGYVVLGLLPSAGGKTCSLMHPCAHGQESRLLKPSLLVQNLRSHGFDVPFRRLLCKDKGVCCKKYERNLANASYLLFHTAPSAIVETLAAVSTLKKAFLLEMQEHVEPVVAGLLLIVEHFCHLVKSAGLVHGECEALLPVEVVHLRDCQRVKVKEKRLNKSK